MKSSEKLKLKRKVPANKSNSRFSKGHFWENKMCQNSITCQSKLSFWVSKIKIGPLLSYFIFKCFISFKICQINYNLLTPISHPFHLTSFLRPDNLKRKLTVCTVEFVFHTVYSTFVLQDVRKKAYEYPQGPGVGPGGQKVLKIKKRHLFLFFTSHVAKNN